MAGPAAAMSCAQATHQEHSYTVCTAEAGRDEIRLFLKDPETGSGLGTFSNVDKQLQSEGKRLAMAMNAGMYHSDRNPVGLYIENGREVTPLVKGASRGNFGMLPNGVFCIRADRVDVIETLSYARRKPECRDASQSGPMLVIDGKLHPRFLRNSDSFYFRNGVGTSADGKKVYFVISDQSVSFYDFGTFFRDVLKTPNALYFDGNISRLYAPEIGRNDLGFPMGPIVGVAAGAP